MFTHIGLILYPQSPGHAYRLLIELKHFQSGNKLLKHEYLGLLMYFNLLVPRHRRSASTDPAATPADTGHKNNVGRMLGQCRMW